MRKMCRFQSFFSHDIIGRFSSRYAGDDAGRAILFSPDVIISYSGERGYVFAEGYRIG